MDELSRDVIKHLKEGTSALSLFDYYGKNCDDLINFWSFAKDDEDICNLTSDTIGAHKLRSLYGIILSKLNTVLVKKAAEYFKKNSIKNPYFDFADRIANEKATVITTNWDLLLEFALIERQYDYFYGGLGNSQNKGVKILKIHGSINWISPKKFLETFSKYYIHKFPNEDGEIVKDATLEKHLAILETKWPTELDVGANFIMPPIMQKDYFISPYKKLVEEAVSVLKNASKIISIGLKYNQDDRFLGGVIRRGIVENYSGRKKRIPYAIIDPEPCKAKINICSFVTAQKYADFQLCSKTFSEWLTDSVP